MSGQRLGSVKIPAPSPTPAATRLTDSIEERGGLRTYRDDRNTVAKTKPKTEAASPRSTVRRGWETV
jgi:hypothetical protein